MTGYEVSLILAIFALSLVAGIAVVLHIYKSDPSLKAGISFGKEGLKAKLETKIGQHEQIDQK